jgi:hypothetical protein
MLSLAQGSGPLEHIEQHFVMSDEVSAIAAVEHGVVSRRVDQLATA